MINQNKPFWKHPDDVKRDASISLWNFNVSHHGNMVVIVSDPERIIGVDVMDANERPRQSTNAASFFANFEDHFTTKEWQQIRAPRWTERQQYKRFYSFWSMKEAYIKALGIGLNFELKRTEFQWNVERNTIDFWLDGRHEEANWTFTWNELENDHVVTVARGPRASQSSASPDDDKEEPPWHRIDNNRLFHNLDTSSCAS